MASLKELQDLYSKNNFGQFTLYNDNGNTFLRIPDPEGGLGYVFKNPDLSKIDQTKINNAGALNWNAPGGISQTHTDESWQRAFGRAEGKSIDSIVSNLIERTNSKIQSDISSKASDEINKIIDQYRGGSGNYDFDPELLKKAGVSPDTTIRDGKYTNIKDYEASVKVKNDPNMVNIGTEKAPMYVPRGSWAEQNYLHPTDAVADAAKQAQNAGGVGASGAGQTGQTYYNEKTGQTIDLKNYPNIDDADLRNQGWIPKSENAPKDTIGQTEQWIQRPGGQPIPISQSGFKNLQDAANAGYSPIANPNNVGFQTDNPLLQDALNDPEIKKQFEGLDKSWQDIIDEVLKQLEPKLKDGYIVNPDIAIDPSYVKEFLDKSTGQLNEFYQQKIGLVKDDLETSFKRLQEDFDKGIRRAEEPFKMSMEAQAQGEAMAGTAYSSGRVKREAQAIQGQQDVLNDAFTQAQRSIEDIGTAGERQIGSENIRSLNIPSLGGYNVGVGGFTPTNGRTLFTPHGSLIGDIPKQRELDIENLKLNAEDLARKQRTLDLTKL